MSTTDDSSPDLPDPAPDARDGLDPQACYRVVQSRDPRFDGVFWTAVRTTGIYCRPSCPARTPAPRNVTFHTSAAAAQAAGFRACRRCRPDASPGSPDWDVAATTAGRAMRLIADGVVDREGVPGLADRLGYTPRHLTRLLGDELGAGPLALARARRAQTARTLVERTDLALTDVAHAAGFASVRQFNQTVQDVYAATPGELRVRRGRTAPYGGPGGAASGLDPAGAITLRLPVRAPFAAGELLAFLAYHVVPGVESAGPGWYARTLDLPHAPGTVRVVLGEPVRGTGTGRGTATVQAVFGLGDLRDLPAAVERVRRMLDADADPVAVDRHLGADPVLRDLVAARPGLRVPGQVDGDETAVRTVVGQQVSVVGARTVTARVVQAHGRAVTTGVPGLTHLFPRADVLAGVDPATLPMPRARGRALVGLCAALADGRVRLDRGAGRAETREAMLALKGIGPWTADYVAMRALGHPDVFLPTDIGVRNALTGLGEDPATFLPRVAGDGGRWSPWRSTALMHLWATVIPALPDPDRTEET